MSTMTTTEIADLKFYCGISKELIEDYDKLTNATTKYDGGVAHDINKACNANPGMCISLPDAVQAMKDGKLDKDKLVNRSKVSELLLAEPISHFISNKGGTYTCKINDGIKATEDTLKKIRTYCINHYSYITRGEYDYFRNMLAKKAFTMDSLIKTYNKSAYADEKGNFTNVKYTNDLINKDVSYTLPFYVLCMIAFAVLIMAV